MFVLDTNVVSELRRMERADPRVVAWAAAQLASGLFISVITLLELEHGVLLKERRDRAQGRVLRRWLDEQVMPAFRDRILEITPPVALACAKLQAAAPQPYRDALIAASAMVAGMTVVTRDVAPFEAMGVAHLDPWS